MQFWGTYRGFAFKGSLTRQLIQAFYYPGGDRRHSSVGREGVDPIDYGELVGSSKGFAER